MKQTKKIDFPNTSKLFDKLTSSCIEDEKFAEAIFYVKKSIDICKSKSDKKQYFIRLAGLYLKLGNVKYSNETLFELLSEFPDYKEAQLALMFNMPMTTDGKILGEYYFDKCKNIFEKFAIEFDEESDELGDIIEDENEFFDEFFEKFDKKKQFTVISKSTRLQERLTDAYIELSFNDYDAAIESLNHALAIQNLSCNEKSQICNAFACCYYNLDKKELCYHALMQSFEFEEDNIDCLCLMLAYAEKYEQKSPFNFCLDKLEQCSFDNELDAFKIVANLNEGKRFATALEVVDKLLRKKPFDYNFNKYRGILYFNMGEKTRARNIFLHQLRLFGDLCDARYYLFFIKSFAEEDFLSIERLSNNWSKLTNFYLAKLSGCETLTDSELLSRFDDKNFRNALEWIISLPTSFKQIIQLIGRLIKINNEQINGWFLKKLCKDEDVEGAFKIEIITQFLINGYAKPIPYVFDTKFDLFKLKFFDNVKAYGDAAFGGYCKACAVAKFQEKCQFKKLARSLDLLYAAVGGLGLNIRYSIDMVCGLLLKTTFKNNFEYDMFFFDCSIDDVELTARELKL